MHVIFLAPHFPANQPRFVEGLKKVGAMVTGIGDAPVSHLPSSLTSMLDGYEYVPHIGDVDQVTAAVKRIQARGPWVDRFESTIESHMYVAAEARERTGIPGLSKDTVTLCRDKFVMKQFLRARGIPSAQNAAVATGKDARAFVEQVGFPVILKPRDGAGAHATYRLDSAAELEQAIAETGLDRRKSFFTMETFISGHEGFYDTITVEGKVVFETVCHYYPNVLEAMRTRWINPQILMTNRIEASGYDQLRHFGRKVVKELGLGTTATHMEWFYGPKGLTFSEIGARPPGCNMWDLYAAGNDFDIYQEWARAICWKDVAKEASRRFTCGLIAIRPSQDGVVRGYSGVDEIQARYGPYIYDAHLPPQGSRTQGIEGGYLANAWLRVRHPDYDGCRAMLDDIGQTIKMWAE